MKIKIHYENETLPDLINGETNKDSVKQILDIEWVDNKLTSCSEFMDGIDKADAIACLRSALNVFEEKDIGI